MIRGGFGLYAYTWSDDTYGSGMGAAFGSSGGLTDKHKRRVPRYIA